MTHRRTGSRSLDSAIMATSDTSSNKGPSVEHISHTPTFKGSAAFHAYYSSNADPPRRDSDDAREGIVKEQKMTFRTGCKIYPNAIAWSILLSFTLVAEAYDKMLIGGFLAFPAFRERYGSVVRMDPDLGPIYELAPRWQQALIGAAPAAECVGLLLSGYFTDKYGYKTVLWGALVWLNLATFLSFFALNLPMLLASQILAGKYIVQLQCLRTLTSTPGFPWGVFQTLSATYAAEVLPVALRPFLLSNINMTWLIGQVTAYGILHSLIDNKSQWAYRIPFALQWAWGVPLLALVWFAPEAPWWLVRHDRFTDARHSLTRLTRSSDKDTNVDQMLNVMKYTDKLEKDMGQAGNSYLDCFRGTNLRRTEIAAMSWMVQAFGGGSLIGYGAYFFEQAGFDTSHSFSLTTAQFAGGILANMLAWFLLPRMGRRRLFTGGQIILCMLLFLGGLVSVIPMKSEIPYWTLGSMLLGFTFIYNLTVGPGTYVLVGEIPSTQLRVKTVVLARVFYNIASIINWVLLPLMLNSSAWNLKGKTCFYFLGTALLCVVWTYFRLPETKGLTYVELDILFDKKAPTPKFRQFKVNLESRGYVSIDNTYNARTWHGWRGYS
jgi:MFS transporter, SP family, general alpha glucoside:H+ symporter